VPEPFWRLEQVGLRGRVGPLTLEIQRGATAILGHSGAGKTSLCNLLAGFERPDSGHVTANLPRAEGRLPLYWAPQDALWPRMSVREHLAAVAPPTPKLSVDAVLSAFGLSERAAARPHELSAGERARLSVARAIASEAAALVLDEPFAHVDPGMHPECWRLLFAFARDLGSSLVYATHEPAWVLGCADAVICLRRGAAIAVGRPEELRERPASPEVALCFGEAAWFAPAEAKSWLADGALADGGCARPERLAVVPDERGSALVREHARHGAVARSALEHASTGEIRRFAHRPDHPLAIGQRVALRVLALALLAVLGSCGKQAAELHFTPQTIVLPIDGKVQPAPRGLALTSAGELLVLDTVGRILVYDHAGKLLRQWRMPAWDVGRPEGIVELHDRRIAVADTHYHRIVFFDHDGKVLETRGSEGSGPGQFIYPISVAEDPDGDLYVSEYGGNDRVQKFDPTGKFLCQFGGFGTGHAQFQRPQHVCWRDHKVYVSDALNNRVHVFTDAGQYVGVLGDGVDHPADMRFPYGLWAAPDGDIWITSYSGGSIERFDGDGRLTGAFGHGGRDVGEFATPWALIGDGQGTMWVCDTGNRRLVELLP
jgi:ABC-type multidrug transport system ATPase subunit/sugar lactone lactonase YvrE